MEEKNLKERKRELIEEDEYVKIDIKGEEENDPKNLKEIKKEEEDSNLNFELPNKLIDLPVAPR